MARAAERVRGGGPYFEDLEVGQVYDAPALTLTGGHAAMHQALTGDRLRLALDADLSRVVTARETALIHPNLVCDVAIGQSTEATQRVRGNLFYRGLVLLRPVFVGDTLRTRTEVVALRQSRSGPTGLAVLRISTVDQRGEPVLDFWRCPMLPLRDPEAQTGHADGFDTIPAEIDLDTLRDAVPADWDLATLRELPGEHLAGLGEGTVWELEAGDTVTAAPELVRLTLNLAAAHADAVASPHGRRLVYGGHTISLAAAHATRALPNLATIVAWRGCDHLGPVFEGDVLRTELALDAVHPLADGGLVDLRAQVRALRDGEEHPVLDWRFVGVMA